MECRRKGALNCLARAALSVLAFIWVLRMLSSLFVPSPDNPSAFGKTGHIADAIGEHAKHGELEYCASQRHRIVWGAKKVSEFMGAYLSKTYGLVNKRGDANYQAWNGAGTRNG